MPVKIQSDFESFKRTLSAKLLKKQLVFSHVFTSRDASAGDLLTLKRRLASYWANASGGVVMDTDITPVEKGLVMSVAGIFPRENLIQMHNACSATWFEIISKRRGSSSTDKFDDADRLIPSYDIIPSRNVISRMGVELEGGWSTIHPPNVRGDGSVFTNGIPPVAIDGKKLRGRGLAASGEISFGPFYIGKIPWGSPETQYRHLPEAEVDGTNHFSAYDPEGQIVNYSRDFYTLYPDVIDPTCGMHVHFSFPTPMIYSAFVDARFQSWLLQGLLEWGKKQDLSFSPFYERLAGGNRYCRGSLYEPTSQLIARTRTGVRYAAVNYCYTMHSTMEIRVLPMFPSISAAQASILELIRLVNVWGENKSPKPKAEYSTFIDTEVI